MAKYSELDGYVFDEQSNVGWGLTLKMADKAPAVAKRIFDTYEHALAYVNDVKDSAIEGLVLSVVDDGDNNGVYFVQSVGKKSEVEGDENINGVLVKLGSEDYTDTEIKNNTKTYSIVKATEEEVETLGANVKEAYKLVDEDNVKVGEYILVYKDSALKSAELIDQQLVFTYTLADNTEQVVKIDVSTFLAESEFKNGLDVNQNGEVSVKVDAASETFLTVGTDGIKLAGVQDAIDTEQARAEGVESGLEEKINNKSQIVDVTTLFTEGNSMTSYTMQELANSHLVYRHDNGPNGTSSVQVTMVAGSAGNSTVVIDDTTTIPTFGNYCTLIFEMHSEEILTQYVAYVEYNNNTFTTTKVNSYVLATQKSIDTLTNKVNTKQDTISDLTTIRSNAALGATALQSIPEEYVTETELSAVEDSLQSSKQDNISDLTTIRSGAALGASSVQIVDVTNLFTNGGELGGYTMQELANSHLVYKDKATSGPNGTSSVQVTMVAGSASNSTAVIDDTTTMPTFGNHFTLIFEIYSEQDDKYILTQYLARVGNTGMTSNVWKTSSVEDHILATQDSIDTLSTTLTNKVNKKQDTISDLTTIRSGAALGATSVQMIDVTSLFTEGNSMTGYTLSDLTTNKLYHSDGNTSNAVKYVGYGDSANEANLVMESFEGAVRNIAIAHIIFDGSTLTTDSVKTYSSNVFVMRVSQVDYDTMKAAGTLDENTLYVIAEITE